MTEKEKALKVSLLKKILREDFGIENRARFMEAYSKMLPIDIAIFVAPVPPRSPEKPDL